MTRRPDPFDQQALEDALRSIGCPESSMSSTLSNYRLFVPLLFAELGEDEIFRLVDDARHDLGLREQETAWRSSIRALVAWAQREIALYRERRGQEIEQAQAAEDQPLLL
jgi:hypothetical protein